MAITTLSLAIGQKATLSAEILDSLGVPVVGANSEDIIWTTADPLVLTVNPSGRISEVTGETVQVTAVSPGTCALTASYDNGVQVYTQQVLVTNTALAVASIAITQLS